VIEKLPEVEVSPGLVILKIVSWNVCAFMVEEELLRSLIVIELREGW